MTRDGSGAPTEAAYGIGEGAKHAGAGSKATGAGADALGCGATGEKAGGALLIALVGGRSFFAGPSNLAESLRFIVVVLGVPGITEGVGIADSACTSRKCND